MNSLFIVNKRDATMNVLLLNSTKSLFQYKVICSHLSFQDLSSQTMEIDKNIC